MKTPDDWKTELENVLASVQNKAEAKQMLASLFTPAEYDELARRWQIIKLLQEGWTHRDVSKLVKVSIATVSRGARELKYGNGILHKLYQRISPRQRGAKTA